MKTFEELEKERKEKIFFNEFKKWNFEDYKEYRKYLRKERLIKIGVLLFLFFIASSSLVININILPYLINKNNDNVDRIEIRDNIMTNEAEKQCNVINQTYVGSRIIYNKETLLVHCSENNLIIGGKPE